MSSGWAFLGIVTLIALALFLNGLRFSRMKTSPWRSGIKGSEMSVRQVQNLGRAFMIAAPLFWLFFTLLIFGVFGPVEGIQTIDLK